MCKSEVVAVSWSRKFELFSLDFVGINFKVIRSVIFFFLESTKILYDKVYCSGPFNHSIYLIFIRHGKVLSSLGIACLDMTYDSFKLLVFRVKSVAFFCCSQAGGGKWELQLASVHSCPSSGAGRKWRIWQLWQHVATGQPSDNIFEIAPARFKRDMWKHFGFSMSRNDKGENVTEQKQYKYPPILRLLYPPTYLHKM